MNGSVFLDFRGKIRGASARLLEEALDKRMPVKVMLDVKRPLIERVTSRASGSSTSLRRRAFRSRKRKPTGTAPIDLAKDRSDQIQHRRCVSQMALLSPLHEGHSELCQGEGDLRLLRAALVPSAGTLCGNAVHSVPIRARRVLCARAPDAADHHDALPVLLREGVQLRPVRRRHAGGAGQQMGRLLRALVVPRRTARAAFVSSSGFRDFRRASPSCSRW